MGWGWVQVRTGFEKGAGFGAGEDGAGLVCVKIYFAPE